VIPNPQFSIEFVENSELTMSRATGIRRTISKDVVPDKPCDPQVKVVGDLKGKVEQVKLLDLDLIDQVLFPHMNIDVFCTIAPDELGGMQFIPKPKFINIFNSTIINLIDLPVFCTTGEFAWCMKFLISRVHDRNL
jgi:hypothetical protein